MPEVRRAAEVGGQSPEARTFKLKQIPATPRGPKIGLLYLHAADREDLGLRLRPELKSVLKDTCVRVCVCMYVYVPRYIYIYICISLSLSLWSLRPAGVFWKDLKFFLATISSALSWTW